MFSDMKPIKRNKCIACGSSINDIYTLNNFPIFMGITTQPNDSDILCDKIIGACDNCKSVQMKNLIPLEVLYENNHNSLVGKTWEKHHNEFCDFVGKYISGTVVEIGGSNLVVANNLAKNTDIEKYIVFDNNIYKEERKSDKIVFREEFFNLNTVEDNVGVIIHTHLIEHLYNPTDELSDMGSIMKEGSYMMFAAPSVDKMLEDNFTNGFNFEHTYMLSQKMVKNMLSSSGFEIVDTKKFSPYVTFYVARKNSRIKKEVAHSYHNQPEIISNFINYHISEVQRIKEHIDTEKENTFIFGAHIFTQYLLGFGLDENLFINVLDNDPKKIGNRLYGTQLNVKSPKILKDFEEPVVVLKAAMYTEEIKKDILENINPNVRFIL